MRKLKLWCTIALVGSMALGIAGYGVNKAQADTPISGYTATITSDMQGATSALLGDEVGEFAMNYKTAGQGSANKYAATGAAQEDLMVDRFAPKPATISWENSRDGALYYTVRVGLEKDLSDAQQFLVNDTDVDIDYLFASVMVSNPLIWMEMSVLEESDADRLSEYETVDDLEIMVDLRLRPELTEFQYLVRGDDWTVRLR